MFTVWVILENIHTSPIDVKPPTPFGSHNTLTIIRNNFFFPPLLDGRNFLLGRSVDLLWNDPLCAGAGCIKK
jgi:hypothetical protein